MRSVRGRSDPPARAVIPLLSPVVLLRLEVLVERRLHLVEVPVLGSRPDIGQQVFEVADLFAETVSHATVVLSESQIAWLCLSG